jgi:putative ABC transport system substrate-binding protein
MVPIVSLPFSELASASTWAKPQDIPVEVPVRYDLVVNLATAKALGLALPESFLVRADKVIE